MKKGFSIKCEECNEMMLYNKNYLKEQDESDLSISILGSYPFQSLYFVCSNCRNELEVEA